MTSPAGRAGHRGRPTRSIVAWALVALVLAAPAAATAAAPATPLVPPVAAGSGPGADGSSDGGAGGWAPGPLPRPAGPATSLANGLDPLPIVVRDLPGDESRRVVEAWDAATIRNAAPLGDMVVAAADAIAPAGASPAVDDLWRRLVVEPVPTDSAEEDAALDADLRVLTSDPRNADRLANLAVAAWLDDVRTDLDPSSERATSLQTQFGQLAAIRLLRAVDRAFPPNRTVLLDLAFLRSVVPLGAFDAADDARRALELDPGDVTARLLLASLESRRADDPAAADAAAETLAPLLADPAHAALGHAAIGDAHLAVASIRRAEAPGDARRHARLAVVEYDAVLATVADPGVYAGRARALELLGLLPAAIEAQRTAVELAPLSVPLRAGLARLQEAAADVPALRDVATEGAGMLATWDAPVARLRFVTGGDGFVVLGDDGFLGWSTGSERDPLPVRLTPQGGGYVVVEVVPRTPDPGLDHALRTDPAPVALLRLAASAAVADGDNTEAAAIAGTAARTLPFAVRWLDAAGPAARLVAGDALQDPVDTGAALAFAQTSLRRLGRFADAAALCERVAGTTADATVAAAGWRCAAESAYHAGDATRALAAVTHLIEPGTPAASTGSAPADAASPAADPADQLLAAAIAEASGDPERAAMLFRLVVGGESRSGDTGSRVRALAALRLGDLAFARDDPTAALEYEALALATVEANGLDVEHDYFQDATSLVGVRGIGQVARNNLGLARLRSLQTAPDSAPDCTPPAARQACEASLADFRAAAASDPGSAVYQLNIGWATRLLGEAEASRAALRAAVDLDPSLYPAYNDLGVQLALDGDAAGARQAFEAAAAAAPRYELARWNLGILGLRDAPTGVPAAQRDLAAAIRLDPSLRTAPLAFRLDERTYRFAFDPGSPVARGESAGRSYGIGAMVLAAATVAAVVQLQATVGGNVVQTASDQLQGWLDERLRSRRWRRLRRRLRARLAPSVRAWLPWLLSVPALTIVTVWQALQGSPETVAAAILGTAYATLLALAAHEAGHAVVARSMRGRIVPAHWAAGSAVSLVLLPVQAATGPFLAERFRPAVGRLATWRFHLAGPAANALVALVAYLAFLVEPLPILRVIAQVQLAVIGYALLPAAPLDGHALSRERPRLLALLGVALGAAATAFALGVL